MTKRSRGIAVREADAECSSSVASPEDRARSIRTVLDTAAELGTWVADAAGLSESQALGLMHAAWARELDALTRHCAPDPFATAQATQDFLHGWSDELPAGGPLGCGGRDPASTHADGGAPAVGDYARCLTDAIASELACGSVVAGDGWDKLLAGVGLVTGAVVAVATAPVTGAVAVTVVVAAGTASFFGGVGIAMGIDEITTEASDPPPSAPESTPPREVVVEIGEIEVTPAEAEDGEETAPSGNGAEECPALGGAGGAQFGSVTEPGTSVDWADIALSCMCETEPDRSGTHLAPGASCSAEDQAAAECLRFPFGPDDGIRPECVRWLETDDLGNRPDDASGGICLVLTCPPGTDPVPVDQPGGEVNCGCEPTIDTGDGVDLEDTCHRVLCPSGYPALPAGGRCVC